MDYKTLTTETYNRSAKELSEHFKGIGDRTQDVKLALSLAKMDTGKEARVLEIGCGDGRDAPEIIKRVKWYQGIDLSVELLKLARAKSPTANFVLADALVFDYPSGLDVVFAFASLLHVNKNDFKSVCLKVRRALRVGGIFFVSLKERENYAREIKAESYGKRVFYYYTTVLVKNLAGNGFETAHEERYVIGHPLRFNIALRKT